MLLARLAMILLVGAAPLFAQDKPDFAQGKPDMATLPKLTRPGTLTTLQMQYQAAWLQVDTTGLYRLTLNGPGLLGLTGFRTGDGRSDGSDPQRRLVQDGSAYRPGVLNDLLLEQGRAYLIQSGALEPHSVTLDLIRPLDATAALPADAMPGNDTPWNLTPGTETLLRPGGSRTLSTTSTTPLRIEVITPPDAKASAHYNGIEIGPGGLFPLSPANQADLRLQGRAGENGALPLMLLRVSLPPYADQTDEYEPGPTAWTLPQSGSATFRGTLLAKSDLDEVDFTLTKPAQFDLSLTVQDGGMAQMRLLAVDRDGAHLLLKAADRQGMALRQGLTLPPGTYRVAVSGERDAPARYTLSLTPTTSGAAMGEPDDQPLAARAMTTDTALRGELAPDNPAHVTFEVAMSGHLWELRGVQGLTHLALTDGNGQMVGDWQAQNGAMALRLALIPGRYVAELRGDGAYALRLSDLGPHPQGAEAEPNDRDTAAHRLRPGQGWQGDFHSPDDIDLYEVTLAAPTPLTLTLTAPDDGAMRAELLLDGIGGRVVDVRPDGPPLTYTALFPTGRHVLNLQARDPGLSGRYGLRLDRADLVPQDEPIGLSALPGDGRITGVVGGFDQSDQIFVPLPVGSGTAALTCQGVPDWSLSTYGDAETLARAADGQVVMLDYATGLGGAVAWQLDGGPLPQPYACRVVFAAPPDADMPTLPHDDAADGAAATPVPLGSRIQGVFGDDRDGDRFSIVAPPGNLVGLRCDTAPDQTRPSGGDHLARALGAGPLPDGTRVFVAEAAQAVELWPRADGLFPQPWSCAIVARFASPAEMGPPAAFTGRGPAPFVASLLQPGRPDWLTPTQITDDLQIGLTVAGLDQAFRAYSRLGQRADLSLTLHNPGPARSVSLQISALAEGWGVTPATLTLDLPADGKAVVPVALVLPPMQSPVLDPHLRVMALSDGQRAAVSLPVTMDPAAAERGPHRHRAAPDGLLGGLNPLHHALGAQLLSLDAKAVADPERWAFLHDGDAPYSDVPASLTARSATFALAAPAPVVGWQVHLRTTKDRSRWPDHLTLELSPDGQVWGAAVTVALTASDLPQVFAVPPVTAAFARITRHGCRADPGCDAVTLADVGLIAAPDWRPAGGLDLAQPALGGHVVLARALGGKATRENPFGGGWNVDFLTEGGTETLPPASDAVGTKVEVVVAFASNRAARIAAVDWVGSAKDGARLVSIDMATSLTGPAGPWTDAPPLPAPPHGVTTARLSLAQPLWARAVRFTLHRDPTDTRAIPDRVAIIEDPAAPTVLGLWGDDASDAGYDDPLTVATPPSGGRDAAGAVPLALGQTVTSSVQLDRNEDWWRFDLPPGPRQMLTLHFSGAALPEFTATLTTADGTPLPLTRATTPAGDLILTAPADVGPHLLHITEPPHSVVILWDTSGSVVPYIPRILEAVRLWATSLKPGRDRIQLLPFGVDTLLLPDWAGTPDDLTPALSSLPQTDSSQAEPAMALAALALSAVDGQRGIVVITDAETSQGDLVWTALLAAHPRVVALSIDSSDPQGVAIMKDWAAINGGHFTRVAGSAGLADGMDLAAALFRAAKPYQLTATFDVITEPTGQAQLTLTTVKSKTRAKPTGGIEVILDASGSMLKRMDDGQRRIAVAHDALADLVRKTLPKGTPFAFRAFGLAPDDCSSELKIPFGPLNPSAAEKAIRATPAVNLAKTGIAASLKAAADDLAALDPPRVMVLVTDGNETCDGNVAATIAAIRARGLDIRLSIVGFAVDDAGLAETFAQWAQQGGGRYIPAGDSAALAAGISDATAARFAADRLYLDGRVETVATLSPDQPITLPAGRYRLRPLQSATGTATEIDLTNTETAAIPYDPKSGLLAK